MLIVVIMLCCLFRVILSVIMLKCGYADSHHYSVLPF
jgi:hypothetical protein